MKLILYSVVIIIGVVITLNSRIASAWNDDVTHKELSEYAAEISGLNLDKENFLETLGFSRGLNEWLKWDASKTIKEGYIKDWIKAGAEKEDSPMTRSLNHFHNTLKSWEEAGYFQKQQALFL